MNTYDMNVPHTWAELRQWPEDVRREYITRLIDRYCPTYAQLAGILGCSESSVYSHLKSLHIPRENRRQTRAQEEVWQSFASSNVPESSVNSVRSDGAFVLPENESPADAAAEPHTAFRFPFDRISLTLTGKPAHSLERLWQLFSDVDDELELTVTAVRKEVIEC